MGKTLRDTYAEALRAIEDAGGIEGDTLRPIACAFDPAVPMDRIGLAVIAAALHERQRRGYPAPFTVAGPSAWTDALAALAFPAGAHAPAALASRAGDLPLLRLERQRKDRDSLLTTYGNCLGTKLGKHAVQPMQYILEELTANIWDHAETEVGFVSAGVSDEILTLAIVDAGISIPLTYTRRDMAFADDLAAVRAAVTGHSARPQGGRGYGLRTTRRIVVEGWHGSCLVASRHATVLQTTTEDDGADTSPLCWNGTMVAFACPLPLSTIDLYAYIEG